MEGSGLQWSFSTNKPGGGSSQILSFRSSQDNGHGQQTLYPTAISQQRKSPAVENARAAAGYKTNNSNKHQYNNNGHQMGTDIHNHRLEPYNSNISRQQSRELKKSSSMPGQRFSSSPSSPPPRHIVNHPTHGHSFLKQQHPPAVTSITPASYKSGSVASTTCAIVGSTDLSDDFSLSSSSSSRRGPSQMTIFYNGLVCVYDDVPLEKAQAIMLLAGNGKPTPPPPPERSPTRQVIDSTSRIPTTTTHSFPGNGSAVSKLPMSSVLIPTSVARPPTPSRSTSASVQQQQQDMVKRSFSSSQRNITPDCIVLNSSPNPLLHKPHQLQKQQPSVQPIPTSSFNAVSSSESSCTISQLVKPTPFVDPVASSSSRTVTDHQPSSMVVRPLASFATANSPVPGASRAVVVAESTDPPPPSGTVNGRLNFQQSAGLPQARNASLQRFLEKRKERVLSVAPYTTTNSKKSNSDSGNLKGDHHHHASSGMNINSSASISQAETTTMTAR